MKSKVNKVIVVGGGAAGWFAASWLKIKNPEMEIKLIESAEVPAIGIGESTIPQLGQLMHEMGLEERDWLSHCHGLYKLGNKFVGWNKEGKRDHVSNHYWSSKFDEQYYSFSFALPEKFIASSFYNQLKPEDFFHNSKGDLGVDDKWNDYWLQLLRDGRRNEWEMAEDTMEATYLMDLNKSAFDWNDYKMVGEWQGVTYHVDAERFPGIIKDKVALPNGVIHITGHVANINKDEDGYITSLDLKDGTTHEADLFLDCSGFHRVLYNEMDVDWVPYEEITTSDVIVAPVKYKNLETDFRPYTQSYAMDEGWAFVIPLYNRMGSGYVFDSTEITPEEAKEKFKKYWEGYEFIREPRHISWDSGKFDHQWDKNCVAIGMTGAMVEPMEANVLYVAQAGFQLVDRILQRAKDNDEVITRSQVVAYNRNMNRLEDGVCDFIEYHYTLTDREDTPFWAKKKAKGIAENHKEKCWQEYRRPVNYVGNGVYPDFMWAMLATCMGKFDDSVELNTKPELLEKANDMFEYLRKSSKRNAIYAPGAYEWHKKMLYNDKSHSEVLEESEKARQERLNRK